MHVVVKYALVLNVFGAGCLCCVGVFFQAYVKGKLRVRLKVSSLKVVSSIGRTHRIIDRNNNKQMTHILITNKLLTRRMVIMINCCT